MFYLQNQTLPNGRCILTLSAPFAGSRIKQRNTFCGSARLPVMYGLWFKRKFQKYKTNVQDFFVLARHIYGGKTLYHGVGDLASDSFGYMEC